MSRPNIVLVVLDTARAATLQTDPSPMSMLTKLAHDGVEFSQAMANAPWTLPSHGTIFTGQHPSVHGAHAGYKSFEYNPALASLLSKAGYQTVAISNNTWVSEEFGFGRGFDEFLSTWQLFQNSMDFGKIAQTRPDTIDRIRDVLKNIYHGNPLKNIANLAYGNFLRKRNDDGAQRTNKLVADRLDQWRTDTPLFLFINYLEPHLEYHPPEDIAREWLPEDVSMGEAKGVNQDAWAYITGEVEMSDREFEILRSLYKAEFAYLDGRISELYRLFEDAGMSEETIFIITGDHGENIGEHGMMDHQYDLHQTLLHVPLVLFGQGIPKRTIDTPVQLADLTPTILDLADADIPSNLPGHSLTTVDAIPSNRPIFSEYISPQPEIEQLKKDYSCERNIDKYNRRLRAVYYDGWKYIYGSEGTEWLYDLANDPNESRNLAEKATDKKTHMADILEEWVKDLPAIDKQEVSMDADTKSRLEDLGYIQ